jgi:hypothetical protein
MIHEVFTGPVNAQQARGVEIPGATVHWITCTGNECRELADSWSANGRILPGLYQRIKATPGAGDELWAGAFSAGGQVWKRAMSNPEDRADISGAIMSDAGYEAAWVDEKGKIAPPAEGYVLYALDALKDGRLFVWTASGFPNIPHADAVYPAGNQVQDATRREIEKRSGRAFEDVTNKPDLWPWGAHLRAPVKVWRLGNVILADYGQVYQHDEHATTIAPEVWQAIPAILASGATTPGAGASEGSRWSRLSPWAKAGIVIAGGLGAVFGARAALSRRR